MTNLNVRVDKHVKEEAEKLFENMGLTMSAAINLFLRQAIRTNSIPFDIRKDTEHHFEHDEE